MITPNQRLVGILLVVGLVLLIPFLAMRLTTSGLNWSLFDFGVAGVVLLGTGLMCELVLRTVKKFEYRIAICVVILAALVLIWIELAVGIFRTPLAGS